MSKKNVIYQKTKYYFLIIYFTSDQIHILFTIFSQVVKHKKGKRGQICCCHTIKWVNNLFLSFFLGKTYLCNCILLIYVAQFSVLKNLAIKMSRRGVVTRLCTRIEPTIGP